MPVRQGIFVRDTLGLVLGKCSCKVRHSVTKLSSYKQFTAAWLAQLGERQSAVREVRVRAPDRTNTQGLKITEENVLPL